MIAKMAKYDFVLYAAQSEDFIEKLREWQRGAPGVLPEYFRKRCVHGDVGL